MEMLGEGENGASVNKETESWHQLPAEEDPSQLLGQTSGLLEADHLQGITLNSEGQTTVMGDPSVQSTADGFESLQLELQDSHLSPALTLIPQRKAFLPSESTLLHQTDLEFFPLGGSLDLSLASERCRQTSRLDVDGESNLTHRSHEQASLSQHRLMSAISEDASSYCSLSQHSLSPNSNYQAIQLHDEEHSSNLKNEEFLKEGKLQIDTDLDRRGVACVSSSGIPICSFQKLLEKDLGVASSSVPSSSEAVLSQTDAGIDSTNTPENQIKDSAPAQKQNPACTSTKEPQFRPSEGREQPQGSSSSLLQRRTMRSVSLSTRLSAISNITVRSTSKQTDVTIDLPLRQLQLHSESSLAAFGAKNLTENENTPVEQNVPPASEGGVLTAGLQRELWSSGNNQTADGSFLTSQPVFQSTPAVLIGRGAPALANRFPVYSHQKKIATSTQNSSPKPDDIPALILSATSQQSNAEFTIATSLDPSEAPTESHLQHEILHGQEAPPPVLDVPVITEDTPLDQPTLVALLPTSDQQLKDQEPRLSKGRVHSLPSLNYVQKVDAWTANQSSSRSFYDNLSLQGDSGVPPKNKEQDSVSEALKQQHSNKTSLLCNANSNTLPSQTGSGVLSGVDVEVAAGAVGSKSPSPFTHSYSHSSLGTVITPIQPDELQQNQLSLAHTDAFSPSSTEAKSSLSTIGAQNQRSAEDSGTSPLKPPALQSVNQCSGSNINNNMSNMVSSLQASIGAASSVVSLELDNYAPYWTSRPGSPRRPPEFNIEDRIPLYLHNLGIDQSPSKILNPFIHPGPIREPEFSPTDLCTIKGSIGTPTKSIEPSDGDSLQKETFSSSSVLSADSSASLTQLFIQKSIRQPASPANSDSVRMTDVQTRTPPEPHSPSDNVPQIADTSLREGSYGLSAEVGLKSPPASGTWESVKDWDSSLVGSGTLQEIRRLLGHAESFMPTHDSVDSFPESHQQNTQAYNNDSFLSVDGKISSVLARSSSDSALKESSSSSSGLLELSTNSDLLSKGPLEPSLGREEIPKSRDFRVAPRRAEPEGCSAADPKVGPVSLSITQGNASLTSDGQQQSQDHTNNSGVSSLNISPTLSQTEAEMCVLTDASSEHSLAYKVAKLLQSESSASVVTSQSSTAEPDESRAREWIMMKVSGAKCETLELNAEDRRRIEEIKRELLLCTKYTKSSSDSESSTKSNVGAVPPPAVGFAAVRSAEDHLSEQLQRVSQIPLDSSVPLHTPQEDRVSQTGIKEGSNPQTVRQCLHTHNSHISHSDIALESNSSTTLRSSEDWKPQAQMTNKVTKNDGGKEIVGKRNELRAEDVHLDSKRSIPLPIQEAARSVIRGKREFPPGLETGSALGQKPHFSSSHFTPSMKLQQNTDQRPHTPASNSCSYPELLSGSHTHHSDSLNTSIGVSLPVSSANEEQQVSVSSDTSLSKDRNSGQVQKTGIINRYSQTTSRYPQAITSHQRPAGPSRPLSVNTAAIPTLLPYKPHGSSELFYMPQTVPELSPNSSDTTVESSHSGSDDAVPPKFTPEVLGSRELVDINVTPKHKEGIYSKRAKMKRESTFTGKGFYDQKGNTALPYQHRKSVVSENEQVAEQTEEGEVFIPLHMEADYRTTELPLKHRVQKRNVETENLPLNTKATREKRQEMKTQDICDEIGSSLDQLWHRFNERYNLQECRPTNDLEISLLERLERLSRLLHSTSPPHTPAHRVEKGKSRRREHEPRRMREKDRTKKETEKERSEVRGILKTAWEEESLSTKQTVEKEQHKKDYRYPAERDESASVSLETSSSQSTIDTQRLIGAFGPHRVSSEREGVADSQTLKLNDGLLKLHNTIKKQKRGHGKGSSEIRLVSVATETSNTDDSMVSDTLSSVSSYTLPSQRGTGRTTSSKRAKVKLVSRSIQAGDLEIVVNGTRKDTRDVGTTFPSPGSARVTRASLAVCSKENTSMSTPRASSAAPVQSQPMLKKQTPTKHTCYPNGLSWFVSADELKCDARKENNPQTDSGQSGGQAWFQPYTRTQPWREPFRERHLQVEIEKPLEQKLDSENNCGSKPSAMVRLSLQEALELCRPGFVSRSRERMKRLCLLVEERKMQAVFNKEREELFNRPSAVQQPKAAPAPPPLPSKRVIPVNEMIQRSKRIYAKLPEVQKRKEEERRKAEYHTYRLNAQLFNKKITNRVLGRRAPWQ